MTLEHQILHFEKLEVLVCYDKIQSRLARWRAKLLNKLGRATLAKSVISAILTDYMHLSWFPKGVCDYIDKCMHNFIWRSNERKGLRQVKWTVVAS
ncbi:hypothetical protein L6164_037553 [Bauhinia variegata]|uniref:Uncharacterized protein n=1 Tax=Bauhinia variegata TaxID=167791 RepID=A0ACB9KKJ8_BAUVA|nr:hypothetical protein L6164_037553 [Bauhinia variegata]